MFLLMFFLCILCGLGIVGFVSKKKMRFRMFSGVVALFCAGMFIIGLFNYQLGVVNINMFFDQTRSHWSMPPEGNGYEQEFLPLPPRTTFLWRTSNNIAGYGTLTSHDQIVDFFKEKAAQDSFHFDAKQDRITIKYDGREYHILLSKEKENNYYVMEITGIYP